MEEELKPSRAGWRGCAAFYASLIPHFQKIARENGYSLSVHGSMTHDLDLVACPWTEEAASAEVLIEAIRESVNGVIPDEQASPTYKGRNPQPKPHGRLGWVIYFRDTEVQWGPYLDISVMPRLSMEAVRCPST